KRARLGRAVFAVHARIFPFDAQRALIADVVEGDDDVFEFDIAVAERAEIPEAARIGKGDVAAEDTDGAVAVAPPDVLHVDVVDALAEGSDEFDVIDALIAKVGWIVVEAEALVSLDGFDRALRGSDVERDLRRMHFQREVHILLLKRIQNRRPAFGEI